MTDLVYVVSRWGTPTQTFVRREAEAVQHRGVGVRALSLKPVGPVVSTVPARHLGFPRVVLGFLLALGRRPLCVIGGAGRVLRLSSPRNVLRQLVAFAVGSAWAASGQVRGASLHTHFGWVAATASWSACRWTGGSFSVVLHAFDLHDQRYTDRFTVAVLRAARTVFTISDRDRELVAQRWGIRAPVLHMGVSEPWLTATRGPVDRSLIVSVGSLVPKKGHDVLIRAMACLPADRRLCIVGEGPLRGELEALVRQEGLTGRVELTGPKDEAEVRALVAQAHVFALASVDTPSGDRDGIPVALMEAMAVGVPVVSTRVGAIPELVEGAGLVVAPGAPSELAAAIASLDDAGASDACGLRCRARVRDGWTSASAAEIVLDAHPEVRG
ncbi:MAG: glycosyltransferase family 4 protein [Acidimicrobiales bacterium]